MNIDERLEKLTERHEVLTQSVESLALDLRQLTAEVKQLTKNVGAMSGLTNEIAHGTALLLLRSNSQDVSIAELRSRLEKLEHGDAT